jgi:hypothetical protein
MAQRRMFSPDIVESDAFLDMPASSQALYFHLGMYADDDGFVNPKRIMRMMSASDDDLRVLSIKRFVLPFENGVVVIKHWRINNLVRKDWYKETQYLEQKSRLIVKDNGAYTELVNESTPNSLTVRPHRLGKVRLGKVRLEGAEVAAPTLTEEKKETPSQIAKSFFERGNHYSLIYEEMRHIPTDILNEEMDKFISYWTEPNKSGTQVRWQIATTFEIKRRLQTWFRRVETIYKKTASRGRGFAK